MTFVPHTPAQRQAMLDAIGVRDFHELISAIPPELLLNRALAVPPAHGEVELEWRARDCYYANTFIPPNRVFAGGGVYPHHVPAVVDEISSRGEFYTAYTPYQPEVSQGYLQAIYEYQSYICMLTGMEISNASGYDMGTTLADAVQMVKSHFKGKRSRICFAPYVHPEAREVAATYNIGMGLGFETLPAAADGSVDKAAFESALSGETGAVVFQYPDYLGYLEADLSELIARVHSAGALAIVVYYPFAAGILRTPGELGADIVCGEAQCLGNYLSYGGPYCGFLACKEELVRVLPGRLIGRTRCERNGEPGEGFVMTLQAREQHIRRDKALSNICTNQALLALRVCIYLGAVGREGFRYLAAQCHETACLAFDRLTELAGVEPYFPGRQFFNEFTLRLPPGKAKAVHSAGLAQKQAVLAGFLPAYGSDGSHFKLEAGLDDALTVCFTESHSPADVDGLVQLIKGVL